MFGGLGLGLCLGSAGRVYTSKNYSIHDFCMLNEKIVGVGSSNYGFVHLDNWATLYKNIEKHTVGHTKELNTKKDEFYVPPCDVMVEFGVVLVAPSTGRCVTVAYQSRARRRHHNHNDLKQSTRA